MARGEFKVPMMIDILKYRRDCITSQRDKGHSVLRPCREKAGEMRV
jgi:hypothetical protein